MTLELSPAEVLAASLPSQRMIQEANAVGLLRVVIDDVVMRLIQLPELGRLHPKVGDAVMALNGLQNHLLAQEVEAWKAIERQQREEESI